MAFSDREDNIWNVVTPCLIKVDSYIDSQYLSYYILNYPHGQHGDSLRYSLPTYLWKVKLSSDLFFILLPGKFELVDE